MAGHTSDMHPMAQGGYAYVERALAMHDGDTDEALLEAACLVGLIRGALHGGRSDEFLYGVCRAMAEHVYTWERGVVAASTRAV